MKQARTVALLTPSYHKDLERFALLCDSIDRHVKGHERHYVIVADDEIPLFSRFNGEKRIVLPSSKFLPKWLKLIPPFLLRRGRRLWWSFRSGPVHGWHIQQLLKISAVSSLPEERFCVIDSDNVFFRPFDVRAYAGGERAPALRRTRRHRSRRADCTRSGREIATDYSVKPRPPFPPTIISAM